MIFPLRLASSTVELKHKFQELLAGISTEDGMDDPFATDLALTRPIMKSEGPWKVDRPLLQLLLLFQYRQRELEVFGQEIGDKGKEEDLEEESRLQNEVEGTCCKFFACICCIPC